MARMKNGVFEIIRIQQWLDCGLTYDLSPTNKYLFTCCASMAFFLCKLRAAVRSWKHLTAPSICTEEPNNSTIPAPISGSKWRGVKQGVKEGFVRMIR